jgi:hypothetical protein
MRIIFTTEIVHFSLAAIPSGRASPPFPAGDVSLPVTLAHWRWGPTYLAA